MALCARWRVRVARVSGEYRSPHDSRDTGHSWRSTVDHPELCRRTLCLRSRSCRNPTEGGGGGWAGPTVNKDQLWGVRVERGPVRSGPQPYGRARGRPLSVVPCGRPPKPHRPYLPCTFPVPSLYLPCTFPVVVPPSPTDPCVRSALHMYSYMMYPLPPLRYHPYPSTVLYPTPAARRTARRRQTT